MTIPKYYEIFKPFLECLKDGKPYTLKEISKYIINYYNLTQENINKLLPSGRQTVFTNRVGWARTYLKKAGLISSPVRATFIITQDGLSVVKDNPQVIDNDYLLRFDSFSKFIIKSSSKLNKEVSLNTNVTPDDTLEDSFIKINDNLADDILNEVINLSNRSFEMMVIDLLHKMGYGTVENLGQLTSKTNDEGIDGIIMEDKLGFNLIYIQAKKWDLTSVIGRPDIQSFVGAITGKGGKGLFVTTAKFSKLAIDYAYRQHIILIDGGKLAKLMIEYNFGVIKKKTFEIKVIDIDVFNNYID